VDGNVAIAPWPEDDGNPYQRLFYEALSPFGFRRHSGLVINDQYLRDHAAQIDAVHLHWPEYAWRVHGTRLDRQARLVIGLARFLRLAGRLGIARVWTAHNVSPHEANSWLDHIGYFVVARSADVIITHGAIARRDVLTRYRPRCPVVVMPHANYQQAYPAPRGAAEVRQELGCRLDVPLLSCVGALRPYKGFELAIDAAALLKGEAQLLIAGSAKDATYVQTLRQMASKAGSVIVVDRPLNDQEFADVLAASDVVLLPYRRITTSAVLLAAWTFGRGVVTTPLPYFEELVRPRPAAGRISDEASPGAFAAAIRQYLTVDPGVRSEAAFRAAADYPWDGSARLVAEPLRRAIESRRARTRAESG
jgi:glycosyltransferase involved in cell wall biosynthesis